MTDRFDIAVVGGGFSGVAFAIEVLRLRSATVQTIAIVDPSPRLGRGVAYGVADPSLLLNGRASTLSALSDEPDDFVCWARARDPAFDAEGFAPRSLYGDYVESILDRASGGAATTTLVRRLATATSLRVEHDRVRIALSSGNIVARTAVLAIGALPKPFLLDGRALAGARFFPDPWAFLDTTIAADDDVLVLGTRLTMIDIAASLYDRGHRGTIHALSRRGLVPHVQVEGGVDRPPPPSLDDWPRTARGLLRAVRAEVERAKARGHDWRDVLGSLRSVTPTLWASLPRPERARFLRHLSPFWEIHRHRAAPPTGRRAAAMITSGQLVVHAGRLVGYDEDAAGVTAEIQLRRRTARQTLRVGHVVDATGLSLDVRQTHDPFVRGLVEGGLVRPDPLGLGFEVNPEIADRVRCIGPMQLGQRWEHTAIPELRRAAKDLAAELSE